MQEGPTSIQHIEKRAFRVHDDSFAPSYLAGYHRFINDHPDQRGPVTDGYIYGFIFKNICDPLNSNFANAGYIVGWIAALLKQAPESQTGPLVAKVATLASEQEDEMQQWIESTSSEMVQDGPATVFEWKGTGLGYFIQPKPVGEVGTTGSVSVDGSPPQGFTIVHESDLHDWYKPVHLRSKRYLGFVFFSERQARRFVRELAPYLDWHLDAEKLEKQDGYKAMCKASYEIYDRIVGPAW